MRSTNKRISGGPFRILQAVAFLVCFCDSTWVSERTTQVKENEKDIFIYNGTYVENDPNCGLGQLVVSVSPDFVTVSDPLQDVNASLPTWTVMVKLVQPLDSDVADPNGPRLVNFTLLAKSDCGTFDKSESLIVFVKVEDVPDSAPRFTKDHYIVSVVETTAPDTLILSGIRAVDLDEFDDVSYIVNFAADEQDLFRYNESADVINIFLRGMLDFETRRSHSFTVTASDRIGLSSTCDVTVNVENALDSRPVFSLPVYFASVKENVSSGTLVAQVSASDGDSDVGSAGNSIRYSIVEGGAGMFQVDAVSGDVTTQGQVDAEDPRVNNGLVELVIMAEEQNSSGLAHQGDTTATVTLHIQIDDVDDNVPEFNAQSFTGSIWELAQLGEFIALADPGFISVEDKDLVAAHNRFSIHVEKDGQAWDVFTPSLDTAQGHVTLQLHLAREGAFQGLAGSEIQFQIIAQTISAGDGSSRAGITSSAVVNLLVSNTRTSPLVATSSGDHFSTAETVITVLVIALLLFIIIGAVYLAYKRRKDKAPAMPVIRRNSYFVSGRSNPNGQIRGATPGSRKATEPEAEVENGERRPRDEEEVADRSPTDLYEPYLSKRKRDTLVGSTSNTTDSSVLHSSSGAGTADITNKHTVTSATNRNRCDVILLTDKTSGPTKLSVGRDASGETVTHNASKPPANERAQVQAKSQDALLSLLDKPSTSDHCDVTSLEEANTAAQSQDVSKGGKSKSYVNVTKGSLQMSQSANPACDVAPLDQTLEAVDQVLNEMLEGVNQRLAEENGPSQMSTEKKCDLVPLSGAEGTREETVQPRIESDSSLQQSDSRKSSFSNTSTTDVAPLIKQDSGKKEGSKKSLPQGSSEEWHINPAFSSPTLKIQNRINNSSSDKNGNNNNNCKSSQDKITPNSTVPIGNVTTTTSCSIGNADPKSPKPTIQKTKLKGVFNLIRRSRPQPSTAAPISGNVTKNHTTSVAPSRAALGLEGQREATAPATSQLTQPDVPQVALALPSFTNSPALAEDYLVITNPVYEPYSYTTPTQNTPEVSTLALPGGTNANPQEMEACSSPSSEDAVPDKSPSEDYMTKAKDLLSEVASSMMNNDKSEPHPNSAVKKSVSIVEDNPSPPLAESREKLTKL